jgi:hypothetical protein
MGAAKKESEEETRISLFYILCNQPTTQGRPRGPIPRMPDTICVQPYTRPETNRTRIALHFAMMRMDGDDRGRILEPNPS